MHLREPDVLRALAKQEGLSYQGVATGAGCSKTFIAHLANGRKTTCSTRLAGRIAEVLKVPVAVLFVDTVPSARGNYALQQRVA